MKQEVLKLLVPLGVLLRSDNVTFRLDGKNLRSVNELIDELQTFVNRVHSGEIKVSDDANTRTSDALQPDSE